MFPLGYRTGRYAVGAESGLVTSTAANAPIWSMFWSNSLLQAVITRLEVWLVTTTAFTAAQIVDVALFFARSFTVADTGGTSMVPAATGQMKQSGMNASVVGDLRVATTGGLTAGTRTLDALPLSVIGALSTAGLAKINILRQLEYYGYPVVLSQDTGLVIQLPTALGAAGVVKIGVDVEWDEINPTQQA
jgi:hypothetical protein